MRPMHAERRDAPTPTCVWRWIDTGKCSNPAPLTIGVGLPMVSGYADDKTVSIDAPTCHPCMDRVQKTASLGVFDHAYTVEVERPLQANPEPIKITGPPTCRRCGRRAPWCSCVGGSDYA